MEQVAIGQHLGSALAFGDQEPPVGTLSRVLLHQVHNQFGHVGSMESRLQLLSLQPTRSQHAGRECTQAGSLGFDDVGQFDC